MRLVCLLPLVAACGPASQPALPPRSVEAPVDTGAFLPTPSPARADAGDTIETALSIEIGDETTLSDTLAIDAIDAVGDRDLFALPVAAGDAVLLVALAAGQYGAGEADDLVLRLLDADGGLLVENDDMPNDLWGTDPGLYWETAEDRVVYIEVLDWGTWATGHGAQPSGHPYELRGSLLGTAQREPDDSFDEQRILAELHRSWDAWSSVWPYESFFLTTLARGGDVDGRLVEAHPGVARVWSLWPGGRDGRALHMTATDADGLRIASATDPVARLAYGFGSVGLLTVGVEEAVDYSIQVEDDAGIGGVVLGVEGAYLPTAVVDEPSDDRVETAPTVPLRALSRGAVHYADVVGRFTADDPRDCFCFEDEGLAGGFAAWSLYVWAVGPQVGGLAEIEVEIDDDRGELLQSLRASGDPTLGDRDLDGWSMPDLHRLCVAVTPGPLPDDLSPLGTPWGVWLYLLPR